MIIVMKAGATKQQIRHMVERVESVGLKAILLEGTNRNVIACIGDKRHIPEDFWAAAPGVERAVPILAPYKIASREAKATSTEIRMDGAVIGGKKVAVIAGPCTVESREQILATARAVKAAGACALRGGAFKPRTNPYTFQGLMEEGLEYLALAREETGLAVVTEVMCPEDVPLVCKYADVLQVGARNMQNFPLLKAVGETRKPVLLKRGLAATLEEFLLAAEYVLSEGNQQVILCERGIRTFETYTRFTLALSIVPQLKEMTHLPIIVDPSHGTGKSSLVGPMSKGAIAVGADGLIIEVHPEPERALLDGAQSITPAEFGTLMKELAPVAAAVGRDM
ncbi:MAG: 3-deoxy-7-phosphoheptulonate synthase [Planctomycetes bacterium]|nr:3-deoxy-7-phosphoheptulonate synthase [Planctomycetota bacterium]MBM4080276.1 3-deoxy-7-phosphoheptulonate synthase [Planctomycetota bacterium]